MPAGAVRCPPWAIWGDLRTKKEAPQRLNRFLSFQSAKVTGKEGTAALVLASADAAPRDVVYEQTCKSMMARAGMSPASIMRRTSAHIHFFASP